MNFHQPGTIPTFAFSAGMSRDMSAPVGRAVFDMMPSMRVSDSSASSREGGGEGSSLQHRPQYQPIPPPSKQRKEASSSTLPPNDAAAALAGLAAVATSNAKRPVKKKPTNTGTSTAASTSKNGKPRPARVSKPRRVIPDVKTYIDEAEPKDSDVVSGRGGRSNNHPGNKACWLVMLSRRSIYRACKSDEEKNKIAEEVVDFVHRQNGRYVQLDSQNGRWFVLPRKAALEKAKQGLRDKHVPHWVRTEMQNGGDLAAAAVANNSNSNAPAANPKKRTKKAAGGGGPAKKQSSSSPPPLKKRKMVEQQQQQYQEHNDVTKQQRLPSDELMSRAELLARQQAAAEATSLAASTFPSSAFAGARLSAASQLSSIRMSALGTLGHSLDGLLSLANGGGMHSLTGAPPPAPPSRSEPQHPTQTVREEPEPPRHPAQRSSLGAGLATFGGGIMTSLGGLSAGPSLAGTSLGGPSLGAPSLAGPSLGLGGGASLRAGPGLDPSLNGLLSLASLSCSLIAGDIRTLSGDSMTGATPARDSERKDKGATSSSSGAASSGGGASDDWNTMFAQSINVVAGAKKI